MVYCSVEQNRMEQNRIECINFPLNRGFSRAWFVYNTTLYDQQIIVRPLTPSPTTRVSLYSHTPLFSLSLPSLYPQVKHLLENSISTNSQGQILTNIITNDIDSNNEQVNDKDIDKDDNDNENYNDNDNDNSNNTIQIFIIVLVTIMPKTHNNEEKQVEDNDDINDEDYDDDYDDLIKKWQN